VMISLDPVELDKALDLSDLYQSEITVDVEGKKVKVVCQDVQFHPVSDRPIHVDFLRK
ncbi:MAG: 50S ribosomal protein L25, partial [Alphaproteobacteria bacterium]|nr:50S ribosomal protein L25 [Alphaproteobacteria bacterium]